jgi:hypothetical protein
MMEFEEIAMKSILAAALIAVTAGVTAGPSLAASGSCGKGKVWDADQKKCVPRPRGSGSHAD